MHASDAAAERPVTRDPRLWALALGNFAMGTGAMMIAGLLPLLADDLKVSVPAAGQSVTAFAVAVALGGPLLAGPTSRIGRRRLMTFALGLFVAANLLGALAPDYWTFLASRVMAGLGNCLFTPHASGVAAHMVSPERRGRAISLVFIGFTMASVLGVPLGMMTGALLGWRLALVAVAIVATIALVVLWRALPGDVRTPPVDVAGWLEIRRSPALLTIVGVNALQILGQMMTFSYIAPLVDEAAGIDGRTLGLYMAAFGVAGVVGNIVCGRLIDRIGPAHTGHLSMATMVAAFLGWFAAGAEGAVAAALLFVVWGLGAFAINTAQQTRLFSAAPALAGASLPLNTAAIYVGQAGGAALGGLVVRTLGVGVLPVGSLACIVAALVVSILSVRGAAARRAAD